MSNQFVTGEKQPYKMNDITKGTWNRSSHHSSYKVASHPLQLSLTLIMSHCQLTIYEICIFQNENGIGSSPDPFLWSAYTASDKALQRN